jgi:hypothetical protein
MNAETAPARLPTYSWHRRSSGAFCTDFYNKTWRIYPALWRLSQHGTDLPHRWRRQQRDAMRLFYGALVTGAKICWAFLARAGRDLFACYANSISISEQLGRQRGLLDSRGGVGEEAGGFGVRDAARLGNCVARWQAKQRAWQNASRPDGARRVAWAAAGSAYGKGRGGATRGMPTADRCQARYLPASGAPSSVSFLSSALSSIALLLAVIFCDWFQPSFSGSRERAIYCPSLCARCGAACTLRARVNAPRRQGGRARGAGRARENTYPRRLFLLHLRSPCL